jgi:hypothetical protein
VRERIRGVLDVGAAREQRQVLDRRADRGGQRPQVSLVVDERDRVRVAHRHAREAPRGVAGHLDRQLDHALARRTGHRHLGPGQARPAHVDGHRVHDVAAM